VGQLYDTLGIGYTELRQPDPRIQVAINTALGDAQRIVNVGAGAGSYEPAGRDLLAVEPSTVMIEQRPATAAPVVRASASALPFPDKAFDASLALLTIHHWPDLARGLAELKRVSRGRTVLFTHDSYGAGFWLTDYLPELAKIDHGWMPSTSELEQHLGELQVTALPIPHDCRDGFLCAYWRRPERYLDARVCAAISAFAYMKHAQTGLDRLQADLESGTWQERYSHLLTLDELDLGYKLVVAGNPA
jgi:SAM-dependent methyltransferase